MWDTTSERFFIFVNDFVDLVNDFVDLMDVFPEQYKVVVSYAQSLYMHPQLTRQGSPRTQAPRGCVGVAAATGISGTGEGPVGKVPLPHGGKGGTAGAWPPQGTPPGDPRG